MSEPSVTWVAKEGNYRAKLENGGFGTTEAGIAGRDTVLGPSRPAMPELLAGYGGTTEAGNAGSRAVLGPPWPAMSELLVGAWFWDHRVRNC